MATSYEQKLPYSLLFGVIQSQEGTGQTKRLRLASEKPKINSVSYLRFQACDSFAGGLLMKFVVIGGDAAGMSAASRAKRNKPDLEVTVLEQTRDVSYSA